MKTKLLGIMALCGAFIASTSATTAKNVPSVPSANEDGFKSFSSISGYRKDKVVKAAVLQIFGFGVQVDLNYFDGMGLNISRYGFQIFSDSECGTLVETKTSDNVTDLRKCEGRYYTIIEPDDNQYKTYTTYYAKAIVITDGEQTVSSTVMSAYGNWETEYTI